MVKGNNYNISGDHVLDEIVEHVVLEKRGVLHEHITAIKPKPKKKSSGVWLIYKAILAL